MANFQLIHITDLHIGIPPEELAQRVIWHSREAVSPSSARPYALEALAEFLLEHRSQADLVLITGDVAEDGEERNLDAALRFIATPARTAGREPTLDAESDAGAPFFILPGNHDRFRGARRLPAGIAFDSKFGPYWSKGPNGVQSVSLPKDNPRLALIAADFCLRRAQDARVYLGQGCAYPNVVKALVKETRAIRDANPNVGIIWVSHFPPLRGLKESESLLQADKLIDAADKNLVRHVIAGHLHVTLSELIPMFKLFAPGQRRVPTKASCMGSGFKSWT
jgi:DNA repair exonuclease SbcCD nuclease subunit